MLVDNKIPDIAAPGAKFVGFQKSRGSAYEVEVTILVIIFAVLKKYCNYSIQN